MKNENDAVSRLGSKSDWRLCVSSCLGRQVEQSVWWGGGPVDADWSGDVERVRQIWRDKVIWMALKGRSCSLNWIWNLKLCCWSNEVMWWKEGALVMTRAREFCTSWSWWKELIGSPKSRELQSLRCEVTMLWTKINTVEGEKQGLSRLRSRWWK